MTTPGGLPSFRAMSNWRERADTFCERGIHGLIVALLIAGPLLLGGTHWELFAVMAALGTGALLLWIARLWVAPSPSLLWPPLAWAVVGLLGYAVLRGHFAVVDYTVRGEWLRLALCGVVFFVVTNNLDRRNSANWVIGALLTVAAFAALYGIFQALTKSSQVWNFERWAGYLGRGSGPYICPNHLAGLLELALPLGLAWLLAGRMTSLPRIVVGYAVLVIAGGLAATQSRGAWVATALALLVFFAVLLQQRGRRIPALILLLLFAAAAAWVVLEARSSSVRVRQALGDEKLMDIRLWLWPAAIRIWHTDFWWGAGPGHFDHLFRLHRDYQVQAQPERAHNDYLNLVADYGMTGAILVAFAIALLAWAAFRIWPHVQREGDDLRARQSNRTAFVLGASVGLLALLLHAVVDFNFHIPANAVAFTAVAALLVGHLRFTPANVTVPLGFTGRAAVTVLGLVVAFWLGSESARRGVEHHLIRRADAPQNSRAQQLDLLRQAHAVEPRNPQTCFSLGEVFRADAWDLPVGQQQPAAEEAMRWFERAWELNPYDGYAHVRYGMCLDLLGDRARATRHFFRALELDPVGAFTLGHIGWHYCQLEDWATAQKYLRRAIELPGADYTLPLAFLPVVEGRLAEQQRK